MKTGSVCTGYGGLDMAVHAVLGGELAWAADIDPGASAIIAHRFPAAPNLGDITVVDWSAVEPVDVLTAGFPCQDVSCAGGRAGLRQGNRTGVWAYVARAIDELRPSLVVLENVRGLLSAGADSDLESCPWCVGDDREHALRALGAVLGDLAELGFDAEWLGLPASSIGACHERWRQFIIAWPSAQDADGAAGRERRPAAPGQAEGWRPRPDTGRRGGVPAPAPAGLRLLPTPAARDWKSGASNLMERNSRPLNEFAVNMLGHIRQPDAQWIAADGTDYGPAIRHWEQVTGHGAPCPTEAGGRGARRMSARFAEWMQGLDPGWVTDVPGLARDDQIRAIGNGVVRQQAATALRVLLDRAGITPLVAADRAVA